MERASALEVVTTSLRARPAGEIIIIIIIACLGDEKRTEEIVFNFFMRREKRAREARFHFPLPRMVFLLTFHFFPPRRINNNNNKRFSFFKTSYFP